MTEALLLFQRQICLFSIALKISYASQETHVRAEEGRVVQMVRYYNGKLYILLSTKNAKFPNIILLFIILNTFIKINQFIHIN